LIYLCRYPDRAGVNLHVKKDDDDMTQNEKLYAVLTGDLVKSSRLSSEKSTDAMGCLKNTANDFAKHFPEAIVGQMDTFRHDSWQMLMKKPALAFNAAIFLRTALKLKSDAETKYDTRICIGIGQVELIDEQRVSNSRGPAFTHSGRGLDEMNDECLKLVAGEDAPVLFNGVSHMAIPLLDCIIGDWTPTESRAVYGMLTGLTQEETARNWPVHEKTGKRPTRQAIGDSLKRAHWRTVHAVLHWLETNVKQI
jgi:hypothetical protein